MRVHLETQVLSITRLEDLVKLRALAKLCSRDFYEDSSLSVVATTIRGDVRRIFRFVSNMVVTSNDWPR